MNNISTTTLTWKVLCMGTMTTTMFRRNLPSPYLPNTTTTTMFRRKPTKSVFAEYYDEDVPTEPTKSVFADDDDDVPTEPTKSVFADDDDDDVPTTDDESIFADYDDDDDDSEDIDDEGSKKKKHCKTAQIHRQLQIHGF